MLLLDLPAGRSGEGHHLAEACENCASPKAGSHSLRHGSEVVDGYGSLDTYVLVSSAKTRVRRGVPS